MKRIFITGTDTGVGKTYLSCKIIQHYNEQGLKTIGLKPIATGINANCQNDDALNLQKAASVQLPYQLVNPYCFKIPTAPTIAARAEGKTISIERLINHIHKLTSQTHHDLMIIEGAGGVHVPFNQTQTQLDFIKKLGCPVILIVNMKLGCINHALMSIHCLRGYQIPIAGWIANVQDDTMLNLEDTIQTISNWAGDIPFLPSSPVGEDAYHFFRT